MKHSQLRLIEDNILTHLLTQGYLTGKLLVATPLIHDPEFAGSVVYVLSHDEDGATGLIINNTLKDTYYSTLFSHLKMRVKQRNTPVYYGGPVEPRCGFILYTDDTPGGSIGISTDMDMVKDVMSGKGPRKSLLALGHASWSAGQLDQEVYDNNWIVAPATERLVFDTDYMHKWITTTNAIGIDMARFSPVSGNA